MREKAMIMGISFIFRLINVIMSIVVSSFRFIIYNLNNV